MKYILSDIVEQLRNYSKALSNLSILTDQPWVMHMSNTNERSVMIFRRKNNELLISSNGQVEKGTWDYIPNVNSLMIETKMGSFLYNHGFFDESIMILKLDGTSNYQLFFNENKIESTIEDLINAVRKKYLNLDAIDQRTESVIQKRLNNGRILKIITTEKSGGYRIGDYVTIEDRIAEDGKYKIGFFEIIYVREGKISGFN